MKKEVRTIPTFNLDLEVVFHTNDVTLNSSLGGRCDVIYCCVKCQPEIDGLVKQSKVQHLLFFFIDKSALKDNYYQQCTVLHFRMVDV
jgi:hypothetical protein